MSSVASQIRWCGVWSIAPPTAALSQFTVAVDVGISMSEDEFVVLLEHAGILETSDENDMEFMEETVLREWLERDGVQLFTTQMTAARSDAELVVDGASAAPSATATATTLVGEARTRMAGHIMARLLERGWIAPIEFDYDEDETEVESSLQDFWETPRLIAVLTACRSGRPSSTRRG
ncbi:unnamed protein product [Phytophthora lilii]|uniref:Unnamed protein product n=1 Tax=Phytophthora lilii TaxID=2077276 RepID=A0A9W6TBM8_9STRA|nr:unnamed protein product [Phytophthora lilii]